SSSSSSALITSWKILDEKGEYSEVFYTNDKVKIEFDINVYHDVSEIQAGMLIRTVEGIPVFGTSTLYQKLNIIDAKKNDKLRASFTIDLAVCEGTYFITLAIAEAISHTDMSYLDRKTDVIVMKVTDPRPKSTGIAYLPLDITFSKLDVNNE
ncbi:Wzt carbohydrate-binding domain-containing protein, partial [Photobacterium kishitanii]|uniref:Wzt carbohydrate-binding domain-containing protein n=1 Tax=Photobacterium kishitanii TaxID=318456 RepID=UPI000D4699C8